MVCKRPGFVASEESGHEGHRLPGVSLRSFLNVLADEAAAVEVDLVGHAGETGEPPSDGELVAVDPPVELGKLLGVRVAAIDGTLSSVPDSFSALDEFSRGFGVFIKRQPTCPSTDAAASVLTRAK